MSTTIRKVALGVGVVVLITLFIIGMVAAQHSHARWTDWCESQGGHVSSKSNVHTGTGVGAKGQPVVTTTTTTTSFCLTADGRILGIEGAS